MSEDMTTAEALCKFRTELEEGGFGFPDANRIVMEYVRASAQDGFTVKAEKSLGQFMEMRVPNFSTEQWQQMFGAITGIRMDEK